MRIRSGAVWTQRNWIRSGFDPDRMCSVEGPLLHYLILYALGINSGVRKAGIIWTVEYSVGKVDLCAW